MFTAPEQMKLHMLEAVQKHKLTCKGRKQCLSVARSEKIITDIITIILDDLDRCPLINKPTKNIMSLRWKAVYKANIREGKDDGKSTAEI